MAEPSQSCTHPWLRVTCGVCGEAVDALGEPPDASGEPGAPRRPTVSRIGGGDSQALFIVARGHPELLDQLRVVMGHETGVNIIEDRREHSPRGAHRGKGAGDPEAPSRGRRSRPGLAGSKLAAGPGTAARAARYRLDGGFIEIRQPHFFPAAEPRGGRPAARTRRRTCLEIALQ